MENVIQQENTYGNTKKSVLHNSTLFFNLNVNICYLNMLNIKY